MSCRDFEAVVVDLARGESMDATARAAALGHAESCVGCAARLASEHALTERLRALALASEEARAPARTEAALLAAFRERAAVAPRRWPQWAMAAAATVLILLVGAVALLRQRPAEQVRVPLPTPAAALSAGAPRQPEMAGQAALRREPAPRRPVLRRSRPRPAPAGEIATEFIPLVHDASWSPGESAQIVRVRLPRSTLVSFGLPMNEDRAFEPVKADVILGQDGVARAIRFVR